MELHQIRYFLAVARARNFSRAAEQCRVAQPSLSQQVKKLEDELGERLFERTKRSVTITPAGEVFLLHAERMVDELARGCDGVREVRGLLRGRVTLGVLPTIAPYLLPRVLRRFADRHPGIEVVLSEDTTAQLHRAVAAKDIDLALVSLPVVARGLRSEGLFSEELLLALPAGHRLARRRRLVLADLEDEPFILMQDGHCLAGQTLQFCQARGLAPRIGLRSAQIETVLAFVAGGFGISVVPEMARASADLRGVQLRPLADARPRREIGILYREERPPGLAARVLVELIRAAGTAKGPASG